MYLRELSGSKFHSVTSSHVILYNGVKNSIFIKSGFIWFWKWALHLQVLQICMKFFCMWLLTLEEYCESFRTQNFIDLDLDLVTPASCDAWGGHHSPTGSVCSQHPDVAPALVSVLKVPFYCLLPVHFGRPLRLLPLGVHQRVWCARRLEGRRATWPNHFRRLLQMVADTL